MIQKYSEVAIIYGGSGSSLARKLSELIEEKHNTEMFPIQPHILQKEILGGKSIMQYVIDMIGRSSVCVIILTFDDADGSRVRQNVLLETGIAWTLKGREKCIFLSNLPKLPEDFPSNISHDININYIGNDVQAVANNVINEITKSLGLSGRENILCDYTYRFDGRILDDIPQDILEKKADKQLHDILNEWKKNIKGFDYMSERVMYLLERIAFLPVFTYDSVMDDFLDNVRTDISMTKADENLWPLPNKYYTDCENVARFVQQVIEYTRIKTEKEVIQCLGDSEANPSITRKVYFMYKRVADELKIMIRTIESGESDFNWLIRIVAYDYAALACLKMYELYKNNEKGINELENAMAYFQKAKEIAAKFDQYSNYIWLGFIDFNLSRVYRYKYEQTGEVKYLELFEDTLSGAVYYRQKWYKGNIYKGAFAVAMSYEYFIAAKLDYQMRNDINEYTNDTPVQNLENIDRLIEELDEYCRDTELGRLYTVRDSIAALESRIRKQHNL
ncbi:MAG: nucleotide-binding protein [Lachnospiraceae bacterium]|nr:nucleotide-binding protein [Lachnospiraceae bacterium]